ncbi:membrane-spanning 4-domains subfamily A member 4A [Xyrichtys novacula]|uniref:Membrane-spanning 4-domains subfamily A member 4A n=1 Tax=Xyrichtys novacula TaxID=13765 RepID=A0AAV1FJA4_XYRNO|nr:membrane-spanning 4-domains subfamily A member 4A [Xyrichtys novacula]
MTSTSVTTVGGLVVVTQVIPQSEKAIPLQAADTIQAPPPAAPAPPSQPAAPTKIDDMTATFLRAGPQSLGIVQIFIGLLCLLFSLTALFSPVLLGHAPLCLAVTFVVSGSVTVSAAKRTSRNHVCVCLTWNIISLLVGVAGVVYLSFLLADRPPSVRLCDFCPRMWVLDVSVYGSLSLLLILLVLHICVSITACVFSVRAFRRCRPGSPVTVMVEDGRAPLCAAVLLSDSDVALLDDGEEPCPSHPNSP